jgi:hypothetical protein
MSNKIQYTILDGRLGKSGGFPSGKFAVLGVAEIVTDSIKTISAYSEVSPSFGNSPLSEFLSDALSLPKAPVIFALGLSGSIPGTVSPVVKHSGNRGIGSITVTGNPRSEYQIEIIIDEAGGLNEAVFHLLIDGKTGKRITVPATPGTYEIPSTGLTLHFDPGTPVGSEKSFETNDSFSFKTTPPRATNEELLLGFEKILESGLDYEFIAVAGATSSDLWIALNTRLLMEEGKNNFKTAVCQARSIRENETVNDYINALLTTEHPNASLKRLQVVALSGVITGITGEVDIRSPLGKYSGWISANCKVEERPGKVKLGSIAGITGIFPEVTGAQIDLLSESGYVTLTRYPHKSGYFFTKGRLMSDTSSDFQCIPERRVMDKALSLLYEKQIDFLNDDVNVSKKDGSPEGLKYFKSYSEMPLNEMKKAGEISDFKLVIPPAQNILSDETLRFELGVTPKGYIGMIFGTIYFVNPEGGE